MPLNDGRKTKKKERNHRTMSILYLLAYLYVYCMLTNSMAQLDYYQAPKNLIPLQIVVHKRRSDNVIYPFDNS